MADFTSLKQTIQTYVKQNGNEEITGSILQDVLLAIVSTMGDGAINGLALALQNEITTRQNQNETLQGNITAEATVRQQADTALGGRIDGLQTAINGLQITVNGINTKLSEGYIYAGIATPSTVPSTPNGKVFYVAVKEGTYTGFGNLTVAQGINMLKYNGSVWSLDVIYAVDNVPISGSGSLITSGAVADIDVMVDSIENDTSVRVFDQSYNWQSGLLKRADGTVDTNQSSYRVSDYVMVTQNDVIKFKNLFPVGGSWCGLCFYDSTKTFIGYYYIQSSDPMSGEYNIKNKTGCAYIRFCPFTTYDLSELPPVMEIITPQCAVSEIWDRLNVASDDASMCKEEVFISEVSNKVIGDGRSCSVHAGSPFSTALKSDYDGTIKSISTKSYGATSSKVRVYAKDRITIKSEVNINLASGVNSIDLSSYNLKVKKDDYIALIDILSVFEIRTTTEFHDVINDEIAPYVRTDNVSFQLELTIESNVYNSRIDDLNNRVEIIDSIIGSTEDFNQAYNLSNGGSFAYDTGCNVLMYYAPLNRDMIFNQAMIAVKGNAGDSVMIHVGIIDQRGWWIEDDLYNGYIDSVENGVATIKSHISILVKTGFLVAFEFGTTYWKFLDSQSIAELYPPFYTLTTAELNSHSSISPRIDDVYCTYFVVSWYEYNSSFATRSEIEEVKTEVNSLNIQMASSKIFVDEVTGDKYIMTVSNGDVVLKPVTYQKIYFAGNSFTGHQTNEYWWGNGRGMAASTDVVQYVQLVSSLTGATYDKSYYTDIERNINNASLDMTIYIPSLPANDYDLLVIQLGENASLSNRTNFVANWKAMIDRFRTLAPNATIIQILGWSTGDKKNAIVEACQEKGVPVIDCVSATYTGNFRAGDYTMDSDGVTEHEITSVIITHPSDVGMALIANNVATVLGIDSQVTLHNLNIVNSAGGSLSIAYNKWPAGGLVSVKVEPESGHSLSSLTVTSGGSPVTTQTHGDVYTFIMPNADVTLTPIWS